MSLDLNGTTDVISLAINATLRPALPISIAAWINPDALANGGIYTNNKTGSDHRGVWFALSGTGGDLEASFGDGAGNAAGDRRSKVAAAGVTTGAWQHVSCSIRGAADFSIYRNGTDAGGTNSGSGGVLGYNTGVGGRIGSYGGGSFVNGRIAEVAVWSINLTNAQHLALARGASPFRVAPASMIQYFPFWGSQAIDLSPAHIDATGLAGTAANHAPVNCPFPAVA